VSDTRHIISSDVVKNLKSENKDKDLRLDDKDKDKGWKSEVKDL